jgi:hypothetical protein
LLKNLALLAFSTLLVLGALELAIRRGLVPEPRYFESSGWWREHWLRGRPGPVPKKFVALHPELGWIPAPNLRNLKLNGARLNTNAESLRGLREVARQRGGAPRIVAVGDSFTFGQCVNDDQSFPAQLERRLPGSEVLNLGVMGYGHDQALQRLRVHGLAYRPDVVVLGFHRMDMPRNRLTFRDYAKPRFVRDGDGLELDNVPVPMPEEVLGSLQPRFWNYARIGLDRAFKDRYNVEELELTQAIVRQMDADARAAGARFMLVYLPDKGDLAEPDPWPLAWLADTCVEAGLACVSPVLRMRSALRGEDVDPHFDCHYSPKVYGLVAEELAEALVARGWVADGSAP